jgi:hypothetical protein
MSVLYIYGTAHTDEAPFNQNFIYVVYGILLIASQ